MNLPRRTLTLALLTAGVAGCSSSPTLTLTPVGAPPAGRELAAKQFSQHFSEAYATRNDDGSYDVVLRDDDAARTPGGAAGEPLAPASAPPLQQVVHLKVNWRPWTAARADQVNTPNATFDWYVLGPDPSAEFLHYAGAGFVTVRDTRHGANVWVRDASMKQVEARGGLADPIGPAGLGGSFFARRSPDRVGEVLATVRTAGAPPRSSRAE